MIHAFRSAASLGLGALAASLLLPVDAAAQPGGFTPVSIYTLDGGQAVDQLGHSQPGQVFGATPTADRHGNPNGALLFDGANDYVQTSEESNAKPLTFSVWFRADDISREHSIVDSDRSGGYGHSLIIGYDDPGNRSDTPHDGSLDVQYHDGFWDTGRRIEVGRWYHAFVTYGAEMRLYLDGELVAQQPYPGSRFDGSTFRFGRHNEGDPQWFKGAIDDVRFYNVELPATVVEQISEQEAAGGGETRLMLPVGGGTELVRGQRYWSPSGGHYLLFQEDGNLVVYTADNGYVWGIEHSGSNWQSNTRVVMQEDGNLASYAGSTFVWNSGSGGHPGATLTLNPAGELQVVGGGVTHWTSAAASGGTVGGGETMVIDGTEVRTGHIQVTLEWDSPADLDLFVTDPAGDRVGYNNQSVASGGQLDVDSRASCRNTASTVENIIWQSNPPAGTYRVEVDHYAHCGDQGAVSYTATLRKDGQVVETWRGSVGIDGQNTYTFTQR